MGDVAGEPAEGAPRRAVATGGHSWRRSRRRQNLDAAERVAVGRRLGGWRIRLVALGRGTVGPRGGRARCHVAAADVAAVVMQEGLANVCLLTPSMTHVKQKIEATIPKKGKAMLYSRDKLMASFYEKVFVAMRQAVDFEKVKCVLIAGPGFVKDEFKTYCETEAVRRDGEGRSFLQEASSAASHTCSLHGNL